MNTRVLVVIPVLVVAMLAAPLAHACSFDPSLLVRPDGSAPRNVVPFIHAHPDLLAGDLVLVQPESGELVDVTMEARNNSILLLVPDQLLEPNARYEVVSSAASDLIESGFLVTDDVDQTPPPRLVIGEATHRYDDDELCHGEFSGARIIVDPTDEPGYVELQSSLVRRKLSDAPILSGSELKFRPKGFERGDTIHVRARWRDAAGNPGEWSEVETIETPWDCGCAAPAAPVRAPWYGTAGLVGALGLLVLRRRIV